MEEMTDLLRRGASMLGKSCPICGTPLFQLKTGEIICPSCNREVRIVSREEEVEQVTTETNLEQIITSKISDLSEILKREEDVIKVGEIAETLSKLLDILDNLKDRDLTRRE
jgi:UPF0148 protein